MSSVFPKVSAPQLVRSPPPTSTEVPSSAELSSSCPSPCLSCLTGHTATEWDLRESHSDVWSPSSAPLSPALCPENSSCVSAAKTLPLPLQQADGCPPLGWSSLCHSSESPCRQSGHLWGSLQEFPFS